MQSSKNQDSKQVPGAGDKQRDYGTFTRLRYEIIEALGGQEKTQLSDEFSSRDVAINQHKECVKDIWYGVQRVIQPNEKLLNEGIMSSDATHYDQYIAALKRSQKESMSEPAEMRDFLDATIAAYQQLTNHTKKYQKECTGFAGTLLRFTELYWEELKVEKMEMQRRRIEMDAAKMRVQKVRNSKKLQKETEVYKAAIASFEVQADKVLNLMNELPAKKENHRRAIRKMMEAELRLHILSVAALREGVALSCDAVNVGAGAQLLAEYDDELRKYLGVVPTKNTQSQATQPVSQSVQVDK